MQSEIFPSVRSQGSDRYGREGEGFLILLKLLLLSGVLFYLIETVI